MQLTAVEPFGGMMETLKLKWSKNKRLVIAVSVVALMALSGWLYWGRGAGAAEYMTAKVERGNLRNTVTATGTLQAVTTVQVGSQASGTISALYADFNSRVKKGQVIAQLDPATTQAQVQQARANVDQSRASLAQMRANLEQSRASLVAARAGVSDAQAKGLAARSTVQGQQAGVSSAQSNVTVLKAELDDAGSFLRQQESLAASGVIARRELEMAQTAYKTAEARYKQSQAQAQQVVVSERSASGSGIAQSQAQVAQAQAQVAQTQAQIQQAQAQVQNATAQVQQAQAALHLAEINQGHTTITSPIDGIVVSRNVDVGQTVAASLSAPTLFTIANDLTRMQVIANIDQADIGLVEQAKGVTFTVDAFPEAEFKGEIQQLRLNPQNVQNVVTYNVVIDVSNPEEKLKPGMTANLSVTIDERSNVVKVPNSALRFTPQSASANSANRNGNTARSGGGAGANTNQAATPGVSTDGTVDNRVAAPTAAVSPGQTRRVWVMGTDSKPQARRIKVGLTDGAATEVVEGDLHEGDVVITGQNSTSQQSAAPGGQTAPGFGGAPRGGAGGGSGRRP